MTRFTSEKRNRGSWKLSARKRAGEKEQDPDLQRPRKAGRAGRAGRQGGQGGHGGEGGEGGERGQGREQPEAEEASWPNCDLGKLLQTLKRSVIEPFISSGFVTKRHLGGFLRLPRPGHGSWQQP